MASALHRIGRIGITDSLEDCFAILMALVQIQ